jgi:hypothetical protein
MRRTTCYVFQSATAADLRGITGDPDGATLPATDGPWTLERQVAPEEPWPLDVNQAVVEFGILENGFYLWGRSLSTPHLSPSSKAIVSRAQRCTIPKGTGLAPSSGC